MHDAVSRDVRTECDQYSIKRLLLTHPGFKTCFCTFLLRVKNSG